MARLRFSELRTGCLIALVFLGTLSPSLMGQQQGGPSGKKNRETRPTRGPQADATEVSVFIDKLIQQLRQTKNLRIRTAVAAALFHLGPEAYRKLEVMGRDLEDGDLRNFISSLLHRMEQKNKKATTKRAAGQRRVAGSRSQPKKQNLSEKKNAPAKRSPRAARPLGGDRVSPDMAAKRLATQLALTSAQTAQVTQMMSKRMTSIKELDDEEIVGADRTARMKEINKKFDGSLEKILTETQLQKWKETLPKRFSEKGSRNRGRGNQSNR